MKKIVFLFFFFAFFFPGVFASSVTPSTFLTPIDNFVVDCPSSSFYLVFGDGYLRTLESCTTPLSGNGYPFDSDTTVTILVTGSDFDINTYPWSGTLPDHLSAYPLSETFLVYSSPPSSPSCAAPFPSCLNFPLSNGGCATSYGSPNMGNQSWVSFPGLSVATDPALIPACAFECGNGSSAPDCGYIPPTPQDISGYFSAPVFVASGSYNWTLTLNLSQSGTINDIASIQLWNAFHVDSATSVDDTIVLSLSPNMPPLDVACATYTVTVPSSLIQGNDGVSANSQPITGSFTVNYCPPPPVNTGSTSSGSTGSWAPPNASGSYMSFLSFDSYTGNYYIEFNALFMILVYLSGILAVFYSLFLLYKKTLLGKK